MLSRAPLGARRARRGAALMMVTVALGLAGAMSVALLASNALRARAARNAGDAAVAHYLAESAANVALYYLQFPERYAGDKPKGFYPGEETVGLGPGFDGAASTVVEYVDATDTYAVTATAALAKQAVTYTRRIDASVQVIPPPPPQYEQVVDALVVNTNVSLNSAFAIDGSIKTLGTAAIPGATVTGKVASDTVTVGGSGVVGGTIRTLGAALAEVDPGGGILDIQLVREGLNELVPPVTAIRDFRTYTALNALNITVTVSGHKLSSSSLNNTILGATVLPLNPAGVYWTDADLAIDGFVQINGTLILRGANLRVKDGATLLVRPANGFPAVVTDGFVRVDSGSNFVADGLVYADHFRTGAAGTNATVGINGALLLRNATKPLPTPSEFTGSFFVRYNEAKAKLNGVGTLRSPAFVRGVKVLAWAE